MEKDRQIEEDKKILKPFTSLGHEVSAESIRKTLNAIANLPARFHASELVNKIYPADSTHTYHERQEGLNRFMQKLRKAGLAHYEKKHWSVDSKQWDRIQKAMHCQS